MTTIQELRAAQAAFAVAIHAASVAEADARDAIMTAKEQRRALLGDLLELAGVTESLLFTISELERGNTRAEVQHAWKFRERLSPLAASLGYELVESPTSRVNAVVKELP